MRRQRLDMQGLDSEGEGGRKPSEGCWGKEQMGQSVSCNLLLNQSARLFPEGRPWVPSSRVLAQVSKGPWD